MTKSWTVFVVRHEQPSEQTWDRLEAIFTEWNRGDGPPIDTTIDFMLQAVFGADQRNTLDLLLARLDRVEGANIHVDGRDVLGEDDYLAADFVGIFGVDLPDGFILNDKTVLSPAGPCRACGLEDSFDVVQMGPFEIDESLLVAADALDATPDGSWDVVNLPGGGLAISQRIADAWRAAGFVGWRANELLDASAGLPSGLLQISVETAVLTPCTEHTLVDGAPYCVGCGRGFGELEGYFFIRPEQTGGADVFARHPGLRSMLHVGHRAYESLVALGAQGLQPRDVMQVCRH